MIYDLLSPLLAELTLFIVALFLLIYGAYFNSKTTAAIINVVACLTLVFAFMLVMASHLLPIGSAYEMFVSGGFVQYAKALVIVSALLSVILSYHWNTVRLSNGVNEYPVILLLITSGLMLLVSAGNFLSFYVSLELASLGMYVLATYERDTIASSEAGIKYFILGSLASGMMLFGISLIYGFSGTISFDGLQLFFATSDTTVAYGVITGLVFVLIAVCFKISAVPFHMWTPDVYEGAPTPVVAFFATAPKVAMLCFAMRLLQSAFAEAVIEWQQVLVFASVASMLVGAFAGLVQKTLKRLIAYSSIGHIGYLLMGIIASSEFGVKAALFYLVIYVFTSFGIFAALLLLKRDDMEVRNIKDLTGLADHHPRMALAIALLMFSMAGIPPLAGFFAKMFIFTSALEAGFVWLVVIAALTSVVACYYYIRVVKIMYFDESQHRLAPVRASAPAMIILILSLAVNVVVINPALVLDHASVAAGSLFP